MKFTSSLLSLFAVTTVYTYSLESDIVIRNYEVSFSDAVECENCNNDEVYIDHESAKACKESFESYYKNFRYVEGTSKNDIDNICKNFESEEYNNFYKKSVNTLPGCETIAPQLLKKYETLKEYNRNAFLLKCTKDENNEYCPLSKFTFYERSSKQGFKPIKINVKDKEFIDAINSSCRSKSCSETAIKVISLYKETAKLLNTDNENDSDDDENSNFCIGNIENLLDDNVEQNVRNTNSNDTTSDTLMKINSYLLLNGLILLFTLYLLSF